MKVTLEPDGPCRQTLTIDIPTDVVQSEFETVTGEFMREARIPGFRPGRAPRTLVERRFAKPIAEQVRDRLMPKYYQQALKEKNIDPVNVITVDPGEATPEQSLSFKVTVDLLPEFDLPDYQSIALKDETILITNTETETALQNLKRGRAQYPEVQRGARDLDLVYFDYDGNLDGEPFEATVADCREVATGRDVAMLMDREREILPGFYEGLLGVSANEERRIDVTFKDDYPVSALAGKTVTYTVRVKTVREEVLPEINAEFLKEFGIEDEAALRSSLKAGLEINARETEQRRRMDAMMRYLLENTTLETLPESSLSEENRTVLQELVQDFMRQGVAREMIAEKRDEITEMAQRTSQERVKLNAILDKIAKQENIDASEDDFKRYMAEMAARYKITVDKALKTIQQRNATESIMHQIRRSKTNRYLMENIKIIGDSAETAAADQPSTEELSPS